MTYSHFFICYFFNIIFIKNLCPYNIIVNKISTLKHAGHSSKFLRMDFYYIIMTRDYTFHQFFYNP